MLHFLNGIDSCVNINACVKIDACVEIKACVKINVYDAFLMKLTHALKLTYDLDKMFKLILNHQNSCVNFKRYNPNRFEISLKIIC